MTPLYMKMYGGFFGMEEVYKCLNPYIKTIGNIKGNPRNYNTDGTVKKGYKTWKYSKHYKKLKAKHSELCRINEERDSLQ